MADKKNYFKISELPELRKKYLDAKDRFIVSDYDGGSRQTKALTYGELSSAIYRDAVTGRLVDDVADRVRTKITPAISAAVVAPVSRAVSSVIVQPVAREAAQYVAPAISGQIAEAVAEPAAEKAAEKVAENLSAYIKVIDAGTATTVVD